MIRAMDVMTTDVMTVDPDMTIQVLATLLAECGISSAPVVDARGRLVGIISEGAGFEILVAQCKSEDEVIEHGRDADGVLTQYAPIGAHGINAFTRCRVIARYGTGMDIINVDAATRRGIQVTNAPNEWCAEEVVDHAVALWLAATRKICQYDRAVRRGEWHWRRGHPIN